MLCRPGAGPLHPLLVVVKVSKDQKDRIELDTFDYRSKNKIELTTGQTNVIEFVIGHFVVVSLRFSGLQYQSDLIYLF